MLLIVSRISEVDYQNKVLPDATYFDIELFKVFLGIQIVFEAGVNQTVKVQN